MNTNEYQKYKKIQKMFTTVENNIFKKKWVLFSRNIYYVYVFTSTTHMCIPAVPVPASIILN